MKTSAVLAALALAVATNAQTAGDLPKCAQDCANQFLLNGIGNCGRDPKCICSNKSFIGDISCCLAKPGGCSADDQKKAIAYAAQLCQANGVTVPDQVVCNSNSNNGTAATSGAGGAAATTSSSRAWAPHQTGAPAAVGLLGGLAAVAVLL
nr:secretory protein [Falciphora oryzae]